MLLLRDYYKNGIIQFQGYMKPENEDTYIGDAYWYDENGFDNGMKQSINKSSLNELIYYNKDGTIWQKIEYNKEGEKSKITTYLNGKELFREVSQILIDTKEYLVRKFRTLIMIDRKWMKRYQLILPFLLSRE
ncbi:hypothetical protein [Niabella ginsengisoli]|uniref:Toxin-antitoxin system YwqK family antitoxin n=1 Tax=Niabella ginsengisoli TaxID=522298 RepID=A0ABS9SLE6_9BACT|nr:hypothetical protein [Niabella ginsengisoli]MCH5599190.1 hypothetical protein [Niabella ginsengisoli]